MIEGGGREGGTQREGHRGRDTEGGTQREGEMGGEKESGRKEVRREGGREREKESFIDAHVYRCHIYSV